MCREACSPPLPVADRFTSNGPVTVGVQLRFPNDGETHPGGVAKVRFAPDGIEVALRVNVCPRSIAGRERL